jgi:hypothetical protein
LHYERKFDWKKHLKKYSDPFEVKFGDGKAVENVFLDADTVFGMFKSYEGDRYIVLKGAKGKVAIGVDGRNGELTLRCDVLGRYPIAIGTLIENRRFRYLDETVCHQEVILVPKVQGKYLAYLDCVPNRKILRSLRIWLPGR